MIPNFPHNTRINWPDYLNWDCQQCRDRAMSGRNKKKFQLGQSYSYIMRKAWYHQIWNKTYLGFIVLILIYILTGLLVPERWGGQFLQICYPYCNREEVINNYHSHHIINCQSDFQTFRRFCFVDRADYGNKYSPQRNYFTCIQHLFTPFAFESSLYSRVLNK